MFGQRAYDIAHQAKLPALAAQKYVFEYQAPQQCGSGSIRIQLYKTSPIWDPQDILSRNAGISTSRAPSIPFAITEFTRISLARDLFCFGSYVEEARRDGLSEFLGQEKMETLAKTLDHPPCSAINPFMRPGHKAPQTNSMPTAVNGFFCIVTPRPQIGNSVRQIYLFILFLAWQLNHAIAL